METITVVKAFIQLVATGLFVVIGVAGFFAGIYFTLKGRA